MEAISRDLNEQLLKVLGSQRLMYMDYPAFERSMLGCASVFRTWEESMKEFINVARDSTRKRSEKFIAIKINSAHKMLEGRLDYLRGFRKQHFMLMGMVKPLSGLSRVGSGGIDMDAEVRFLVGGRELTR